MADLSILEFGVYGFVTYVTLLMLILSIIKPPPTTRELAIVRAIYIIPGLVCAGILALFGSNILTGTITTTNTITDLNTSEVWTEATAQTTNITLQSEIWVSFHLMLFFVFFIYFLQQIINLLTKHD